MLKPWIGITLFLIINMNTQARTTETFVYVSPQNNARYIKPQQDIILKTSTAVNPESLTPAVLTVLGEESGKHTGTWMLSEDGKTCIFKPAKQYLAGEKVYVKMNKPIELLNGNHSEVLHFSFQISEYDEPISFYSKEKISLKPFSKSSGQFTDELPEDLPMPTVETIDSSLQGYIFMNLFANPPGAYSSYLLMLDKLGTPVFYRKFDNRVTDFKLLDNGKLCFHYNNRDENYQCYYLMDEKFNITDSVMAGNGYQVDHHEMILLENGHYMILIYDPQAVDMSEIVPGGSPWATVIGLVIQEVDTEGNVYFQWRSWDHFEITDATDDIDLTEGHIDYVHGNALEIDKDGNILLSSRHLDEVTKIDYETGDVIWRMGLKAKNNDFEFINDSIGFSHQHDINLVSDSIYTLYDNGNLHEPPFSRALQYLIDEDSMQVTRIWDYRKQPDIYGFATGSYQDVNGEHAMICWGYSASDLVATEVDYQGNELLNLSVDIPNVYVYRTYRFDWETTALSFDQKPLVFDSIDYTSHAVEVISLKNNLDHNIQVTGIDQWYNVFTVLDEFPIEIAANQSKTLEIRFEPSAMGMYEDLITFNYDINSDSLVQRIAVQLPVEGKAYESNDMDESSQKSIRLYPNPFKDKFKIYSTEYMKDIRIKIYNTKSQLVAKYEFEDFRQREIDLSRQPNGVYYCQISRGKSKNPLMIKVIKN